MPGTLRVAGSPSSLPARRYLVFTSAAVALVATTLLWARTDPAPRVTLNWLGDRPPQALAGVSWGVPWPKGTVPAGQAFVLRAADGAAIPVQAWPLAYWPDGSLKWSGFAAAPGVGAKPPFTLQAAAGGASPAVAVSVQPDHDAVVVNTGKIVCRIPRQGSALIDSLSVGGVEVARTGRLECLVQDGPDDELGQAPRRERYVSQVDRVTVEQSGPVRAVIKIEGRHRGSDRDRVWLPFVVRLYFYAGEQTVRVVHTIIFDGDAGRDFIRGLGLVFDVPLREQVQNRQVRFSGENGGLWSEPVQPGAGDPQQSAGERIAADGFYGNDGDYAIWSDFRLTQSSPDGFTISKRTNARSAWIFAGAGRHASGLAYVGDVSGGFGIAEKDFWPSYPAGLEVRNAGTPLAELIAWLWSPAAPAMDLRHYDTRAHGLDASYEDVQPGLSTPYGVARTTELTLFPSAGLPSKATTVAWAASATKRPLLVASPAYIHGTGVFGVWSLPDRSTPAKAAVEDRLDAVLAYYRQQVADRYWYGFWHYGDFIHSYNRAAHAWYYDFGGHAWDNTELGAPLWLWYSFLRTGREDVFRLAEAHTRNTSETDVYHIGPMAGLGSRHNVIKWGDGAKEARISQAAHWRPFYYLTTDERTGDIMREMVHSDVAAMRFDPMREAQPVLPQDPKYPGRIRIGPDWFALAGNWMTEWERTGDPRWRDRIMAGVDSILAMPYWIRSGVRDGLNPDLGKNVVGPLKGGGSMTVGYDPATGRLLPIPDPLAHAQVAVNYNLATIQGGAEVMFELVPLLGRADWAKAWLQYCRLGRAPAEVLVKDRTTGHEGGDAQYVEEGQGGARLAAYAYSQTNNPAFAQFAIRALGRRNWPVTPTLVQGPDSLQPVHEVPAMSTNEASQASLTAIEILALCADRLPAELPPSHPPLMRPRRHRPASDQSAPASAAVGNAETEDTPAAPVR